MHKVVHCTSVHTAWDIRIFKKQCRSLAGNGYEVVLIAPGTGAKITDGVSLRTIRSNRSRIGRFVLAPWRVYRAFKDENADVFHFHDPELLPLACFLRARGRVVVFDMHENLPKAVLTKGWIPAPLRRPAATAVRAVERLLLAKIPTVFAEASYAHEYPWIEKRVVVQNYPLVDEVAQYRRPLDFNKPRIGYVGGVAPGRGSTLYVRAVGLLRRRGVDVGLDLIGRVSAQHARELTALAEEEGVSQLRLHGLVTPDVGWRAMSGCCVGLGVLEDRPNYVSSYPTKLFEYMALGIPFIASDFPLYRQLADETGGGICVPPGEPEMLADAIQWMLEHPEDARAMGERGAHAVSQEFDWGSEFKKLLAFYDEITQ